MEDAKAGNLPECLLVNKINFGPALSKMIRERAKKYGISHQAVIKQIVSKEYENEKLELKIK